MSERFTSGGVGRFGFDEANATLEAADAMVGRFSDAGRPIQSQIPKPILARLIGEPNTTIFASAPIDQRFKVWNWKQANVDGTSAARVISDAPQGKEASEFGDFPEGRAIQLGGTAEAGTVVLLFRVMSADGSVWYGFVGRDYANPSSMLTILEAVPNGKNRWLYTVVPVYWNGSARTDLPSGLAVNANEISAMHGQRNTFENPDARIEIEGPVEGPVVGSLASPPDSLTAYWVFDAPNPIIPECIDPAPQIERLLKGGL